jgi:hypothetical protein
MQFENHIKSLKSAKIACEFDKNKKIFCVFIDFFVFFSVFFGDYGMQFENW